VFETNPAVPLLRVAWNRQDPNYLATIPLDSKKLYILDTRVPSLPVAELEGHAATINGVVWAPHSSCHVCTCGDDHQALIWDLSQMPKPIYDPILAYTAEGEVNQLAWSSLQPDWVSIAIGMKVQILRV
jgi:DDB1- and CUL4-associated factor 7